MWVSTFAPNISKLQRETVVFRRINANNEKWVSYDPTLITIE